jgi:hypothetical protein
MDISVLLSYACLKFYICQSKPGFCNKRYTDYDVTTVYPKVSGLSQNKITINMCWEATQRVMAAKLTRLTHKVVIQLHLVAESYTSCSSRSRQPVQKLSDTPSYIITTTTFTIPPINSIIKFKKMDTGCYWNSTSQIFGSNWSKTVQISLHNKGKVLYMCPYCGL